MVAIRLLFFRVLRLSPTVTDYSITAVFRYQLLVMIYLPEVPIECIRLDQIELQ